MGPEEPPGACDLGALRTPKGLLLGAELVLCALVVGLLAAPAPPTLGPALLQTLVGGAALGAWLLRAPPRLPPGYGPCLDLLRAVSGAVVFLAAALAALGSARDAMAAAAFTFSLLLAFLFALDAFVTHRAQRAPPPPDDGDAS